MINRALMFAGMVVAIMCAAVRPALSACAVGQVPVHLNETIAFEGDSLTYGFDKTATGTRAAINNSQFLRSVSPFPETVGDLLGHRVVIVNRGYPGDRSTEGWQRWSKAPPVSVAVLMYGTNDYGNYGGYPTGPLTVDQFRATLERLIARRQAQGARVVLMTPPPLEDPKTRENLSAYVHVVGSVARDTGSTVVDTGEILSRVRNIWTDGIHLSVEANIAIATAIAARICID